MKNIFRHNCPLAQCLEARGVILNCLGALIWAFGGALAQEDFRVPAGFVYEDANVSAGTARRLADTHAVLTLLNLKEVSEDVARNLVARGPDTFLTLPALASLDRATAHALSGYKGQIRLWGLRSIAPDVAAALVSEPGNVIDLRGIREISGDGAGALATSRRGGVVLGLTELSKDVAEILASSKGSLSFPQLERLSLASAAALSKHQASLDLGHASISVEVAQALLAHAGRIELPTVNRLEPGVGEILSKHEDEVILMLEEIDSPALARKIFSEPNASSSVYRLRTMSREIAEEYSRARPGYLAHLDSLTPDAAEALASSSFDLTLPAISHLSPELAAKLTDRTNAVYLRGVVELIGPEANAVAEALVRTPAPVYLDKLKRVSSAAFATLKRKSKIVLPPQENMEIVR